MIGGRIGSQALHLAGALCLAIVIWQAVAWSAIVPDDYFPGVGTILAAFVRLIRSGELIDNERLTFLRVLIGIVLSCALGIGLALAGTLFPLVRYALRPLVSIFQVLPPAAFVPLAVFFLGFGETFFLVIICFAATWPAYLAALRALGDIDPILLASGRSYGYRPWEIVRLVRVPAAMPEIFTGIRLTAGIALVAAIACEMLASRNGLGFLLFDTAFSLRVDETFAVLFAVALNGLVINGVVVGIRHFVAGWSDRLARTAE